MHSTVKTGEFIEVPGGTLSVLSGANEPSGPAIPLGSEPCIVGRGSHCHMVLDDARVSTSHCQFTATAQGVELADLDSTNGTFVNQVRLQGGGAVYLPVNARVRVGQTWIQFQSAGSEQVPVSGDRAFGPIVGHSVAMRRIYAQLAKTAFHDLSVLIRGETGTGKELVAHAIHKASRRSAGPFITVDCTNIPTSLAESILFGHEKGAFTGAIARRISPFVAAHGGTIFLDEVGELPLEIQPKLLRALEAREVQSVGSHRYQAIDVRVIAATNRNLHAEMNAKRFRDDLYFRFAQVIVELPPLRERPEDIPALVGSFLSDLGDPSATSRIDKPSMERLRRHRWPGNVRELRNVVLTAHAQSAGGPIDFGDVLGNRAIDMTDRVSAMTSFAVFKRERAEALEREYADFFSALHHATSGNVSEMARRSGLSRAQVREYLQRYGLRGED